MAKRRTNGEGTIKKRNDGLWEASITLPDGKRKSVYGKTQKAAKEKMQAAYDAEIAKALEEERRRKGGITMGAWSDIWLTDYASVKHSTLTKYHCEVRTHIKPELGSIPLCDLTTRRLQQLYKKKEREGLSLKSIKNLHSVIHCMLDQAVKENMIPVNVSNACTLKSPEKKEMHVIKDERLADFLTAIRGHEYEYFWYVMMFTGLRRSEAIGLTWDCVDFKAGQIHVYRQWRKAQRTDGGTERRFESLKNNKTRIVKPARQVMEVLKEVRKRQNERKLACGGGWRTEYDFVFTRSNGVPYNGDMVLREFKKIVESIGIGQTRIHDLRHTYATLSLQNGTDIKTVSDALGHATTAFTMDQYGHVTERMRQESAQRMEHLINTL